MFILGHAPHVCSLYVFGFNVTHSQDKTRTKELACFFKTEIYIPLLSHASPWPVVLSPHCPPPLTPPQGPPLHHIKAGNGSASIVITNWLEAKFFIAAGSWLHFFFFNPLFTYLSQPRGQTQAGLSVMLFCPLCGAFWLFIYECQTLQDRILKRAKPKRLSLKKKKERKAALLSAVRRSRVSKNFIFQRKNIQIISSRDNTINNRGLQLGPVFW